MDIVKIIGSASEEDVIKACISIDSSDRIVEQYLMRKRAGEECDINSLRHVLRRYAAHPGDRYRLFRTFGYAYDDRLENKKSRKWVLSHKGSDEDGFSGLWAHERDEIEEEYRAWKREKKKRSRERKQARMKEKRETKEKQKGRNKQ